MRVVGRSKAALIGAVATITTFAIGGIAVAFPAEAATSYTTTAGVNVRKGPGTNTTILGVLPKGTKVTPTGPITNGWAPFTYNGKPAYVSASFLKTATGTTPTSTTATTTSTTLPAVTSTRETLVNVNVRTGPTLDDDIVTVLTKGTKVGLTGKVSGKFTQIVLSGKVLWIYTSYLSTASTSTSPTTVGKAVTTALLALREEALITAKNLGDITVGSTVALTGKNSASYTQVVVNGQTGWVLAGYLKVSGANPLPAAIGKRYVTGTSVNVRTGPSTTGTTIVDKVSGGTLLLITGVVKSSYTQIIYAGQLRWITTSYLAKTAPTATSSTPTPTGSLGSSSLDRTNAYAHAIVLAIREKFPEIKTIYGWRAYSAYSSDHPHGRALDIMIPRYSTASGKALGDAIARFLQENHKQFHVHYMIWRQRNWNVERNLDYTAGWRWMADRGGATANHYDHVHVSVYSAPSGA